MGTRGKWEDWMLEGEEKVVRAGKEPLRKLVMEWIIDDYANISNEMGRNACGKKTLNGLNDDFI
jgi:hypothetical protein